MNTDVFLYVECDVQFTSDGVPVLLHDATIDRTSNSTGEVTSKTLVELKALDFGTWFSTAFAGTTIPTFDGVIGRFYERSRMSSIFCILLMIFAHIVDDYYLQGWLADGKQKAWWEQNAPSPLYRFDYIVALVMHALSWAFMIMLPVGIFTGLSQVGTAFVIALLWNATIHAYVDNLKANRGKINLVIDQSIHLTQIAITAWIFVL